MTIKVTRQLIAGIREMLRKRQPASYQQILKWDRNQPRGAKGTHEGGRWVKDVSQGLGTSIGWGVTGARPAPGMERTMGQAAYTDILNAAMTAPGFKNTPVAVSLMGVSNLPGQATTSTAPKSVATLEVLKSGTAVDSRSLGPNTNASAVVTLEKEGLDPVSAMYKPERGETWDVSFSNYDITKFVTNRQFSLAEREAFAYEVDDLMRLGLVPYTVLREKVDETNIEIDVGDPYGGDMDSGGEGYTGTQLQSMYRSYKEAARERAEEYVGDEMARLFGEAQQEHITDIENRAGEMGDIWNDVLKEFPDAQPYGSPSALKEHPVLPLGSAGPFQRKELLGALDPMEILKEANVDVTAAMSGEEKQRVEAVLREKLKEGYQKIGDVDHDAALADLDMGQRDEEHRDTESRLMGSRIQTFTEWRVNHSFKSKESPAKDSNNVSGRNPEAPHPQGGSFQQFHGNADMYGNANLEDGTKLAVLDYVIGTMDRHGKNLLFENDVPVAIDNGYSMPAAGSDEPDGFTFRTDGVRAWLEGSGSKHIPEELRSTLHEAITQANWQALVDRHPSMNADERAAFLGRVENMKEALQTAEGLYKLWRKQQIYGYQHPSSTSSDHSY